MCKHCERRSNVLWRQSFHTLFVLTTGHVQCHLWGTNVFRTYRDSVSREIEGILCEIGALGIMSQIMRPFLMLDLKIVVRKLGIYVLYH